MKFSIKSTCYGTDVFPTYENAIKKFNYEFVYHADWEKEICFIDFKDLEELVRFQKEIENDLILSKYDDNCLEIYDDYRE